MNASTVNRQSSSDDDRPAILIFGASARAAAQSATRAGLNPIAADLFGDVDLHEEAIVIPLRDYPDDFVRLANLAPPCPWIYTGGLENHPVIVSQVSANRILWGNPAHVLQRVRDPFHLHDALYQAGRPTVPVRSTDSPPPPDGNWLLKPIGGAGGGGINVWDETVVSRLDLEKPHYFQQRRDGISLSAVYIAADRQVQLVGVTRQFVGSKSWAAGRFSYCGSVGPCSLPPGEMAGVASLGQLLGQAFGLRGLFGVDMIWDGSVAIPIEVNPRYVASTEVLERALDIPLLAYHRHACETFDNNCSSATLRESLTRELRQKQQDSCLTAGKAILFAPSDLNWPVSETIRQELSRLGSQLADIPQPGMQIIKGRPICTVLANGNDPHDCRRRLARSVRLVKRFISADGCS